MNKARFGFSIAVVALMVATPAMGQLPGFPVLGLFPGDADGATSVGAGWGRGLNDQSGKLNALGVGAVRAMEQVSFGVFGSFVLGGGETIDSIPNKFGLAGAVAYHLPLEDLPVSLSVQVGAGWIKDAITDETVLNFPIGVVVSGSTEAGSLMVRPWVMPRFQITRFGTPSVTQKDFGASGGVAISSEGGWGLSLALDWLLEDDFADATKSKSALGFMAAVVYALP